MNFKIQFEKYNMPNRILCEELINALIAADEAQFDKIIAEINALKGQFSNLFKDLRVDYDVNMSEHSVNGKDSRARVFIKEIEYVNLGLTPLMVAACYFSKVLNRLLQEGADKSLEALTPAKDTALRLAAWLGNSKSVRILRLAGANPNDSRKDSNYHLVNNLLNNPAISSNIKLACLKAFCKPELPLDGEEKANANEFPSYEAKKIIAITPEAYRAALKAAIDNNLPDVIEYLCSLDVIDINKPIDDYGETFVSYIATAPLNNLLEDDRVKLLEAFFNATKDKKPDLEKSYSHPCTTCDSCKAKQKCTAPSLQTAVIRASSCGYPKTIKVLHQHGAKIDVFNKNSCTVLHIAKNAETVTQLVALGANVFLKADKALDPIEYMARYDHHEQLQAVLATKKSWKDEDLINALHWAANNNHKNCVEAFFPYIHNLVLKSNGKDIYDYAKGEMKDCIKKEIERRKKNEKEEKNGNADRLKRERKRIDDLISDRAGKPVDKLITQETKYEETELAGIVSNAEKTLAEAMAVLKKCDLRKEDRKTLATILCRAVKHDLALDMDVAARQVLTPTVHQLLIAAGVFDVYLTRDDLGKIALDYAAASEKLNVSQPLINSFLNDTPFKQAQIVKITRNKNKKWLDEQSSTFGDLANYILLRFKNDDGKNPKRLATRVVLLLNLYDRLQEESHSHEYEVTDGKTRDKIKYKVSLQETIQCYKDILKFQVGSEVCPNILKKLFPEKQPSRELFITLKKQCAEYLKYLQERRPHLHKLLHSRFKLQQPNSPFFPAVQDPRAQQQAAAAAPLAIERGNNIASPSSPR